jgi:hypothetical protein
VIAGAGIPAPAAPAPANGARVKDIQERMYTLKQGDSFVTLSQYFYGSPIYAEAIRKYVQNDFRSTSASLRQGNLLPNERIFVPADPQELATR